MFHGICRHWSLQSVRNELQLASKWGNSRQRPARANELKLGYWKAANLLQFMQGLG